jgi:nuclear transport factor 2 (NTF2) superfamily protein
MSNRQASINDVKISAEERWFAGLKPEEVDGVAIPFGHV